MTKPKSPTFPSVGIDLDGTIDEAPLFFRLFSEHWPGKVYIITYRDDFEEATRDVEQFGIRYDELVMVRSFEQKALEIDRRNISVHFDDQDEMLQHISKGVTVLKVRNGGNFDFDTGQWLYSAKTGRELG